MPVFEYTMEVSVLLSLFSDARNGLPGNDDFGQMSAWLVFTLAGFYPVEPCAGSFVLGRPFFPTMAP